MSGPRQQSEHRTDDLRLGRRDTLAFLSLAALAGVLYLPRLLPGTGYSPDTMKYHYLGAVLGISHPPGSPLYVLADWAVAQIPLGELAWRLNLFSALCAGVAAGFLYLVGRDLARSRLAGWLAAVGLLTTGVFWQQSVIAEVYTPHAALLIVSVWAVVRWHRTGAPRDIGAAGATYGLSYGVHLMSSHLLPGWAVLTLFGPRSILRRRREATIVAGGALLGASTYLYYAIRPAMHPLYVEQQIDSLGTFIDFVTGSYFREAMFAYDTKTMVAERLPWLADLALANVGLPVLGLGLAGILALFRQDFRLGVFVAAPVAISGLYAMGYAVADPEVFTLPALYMLLVAAAVGLGLLWRALGRLTGPNWHGALCSATIVLLVFERSGSVAVNGVVLDRSGDREISRYAERVVETVDDQSTIVAGNDWSFHALAYYLWGLRVRPTADIGLNLHSLLRCDEVRAAVDAYLRRGAVYLTAEATECVVPEQYDLQAWDFSRTLPDYLAALPPGRLVLLGIEDEGTAGIDEQAWEMLTTLGVLDGMRDRYRWSYAAALVRTPRGFVGLSHSGEDGAAVDVLKAGRLAEGVRAPFALSVQSGGQLSGRQVALVADGVDYARAARGVQVVVFDAATGAPLERQAFDTHRTTSLGDFPLLKLIRKRQP